MANVPYMPVEPAFIHGLANITVTLVAHARHHLTIELTNLLELLTGHREAAEGGADLFVEVLWWRVESLLLFRLDGQRDVCWVERLILMVCPGECEGCGPARREYTDAYYPWHYTAEVVAMPTLPSSTWFLSAA